ncbi:patatin-like phospholipase family protein [Jannaschia aquimarina]|uniref:Patatin-like phospholipase n=1 Tax=Jannaschia aquimarina TaxID=935700 RepID=A0A0D1EMM6_9RHOB|nr:patatin-like phospholipase family protein [Jannaschia aquimarina]KIT18226.1 Patatin-like phospholipase [Jannaschia aquimarina]SNS82950.1 NTE family protein [Jannaschia aquimarina]
MSGSSCPRRLSLALQGGGSFGAFTWGVLDALLSEGVEIAAVTGTSAGAVNAVLLAHGYATAPEPVARPAAARAALDAFWTRCGRAALASPTATPPALMATPVLRVAMVAQAAVTDAVQALAAPAQRDPLGLLGGVADYLFDPIDFAAIRTSCGPEGVLPLRIAATRLRDANAVLFDGPEIDRARVMASACLPTLFPPVEVDGETYWDGGFSANPPLMPFAEGFGTDEVLLVNLNPREIADPPHSAHDIAERMSSVAFQQAMLSEVARLEAADDGEGGKLRRIRLHRIEGGDTLVGYGLDAKLNAHPAFLAELKRLGREAALEWLADDNYR